MKSYILKYYKSYQITSMQQNDEMAPETNKTILWQSSCNYLGMSFLGNSDVILRSHFEEIYRFFQDEAAVRHRRGARR